MPPRKSGASIVSVDDNGAGSGTPAGKESGTGVEEYNLPRTMVQRLSKGVLPPNTQIQKDALLAISKSATVFVNYLTSYANEQAQHMNKKTIQPKDVFDAIREIELDSFLPRLEGELTKYNSVQCDKRNTYRRKIRDEQKAKAVTEGGNPTSDPADPGAAGGHDDSTISATSANGNGTSAANGHREGDGEPPAAKKLRRENGDISDADQSGDEGMPDDDEAAVDDDEEEGEDDDGGDEDEFEDAREEFAEDALEEREGVEEGDDEVLDGEDSDY